LSVVLSSVIDRTYQSLLFTKTNYVKSTHLHSIRLLVKSEALGFQTPSLLSNILRQVGVPIY